VVHWAAPYHHSKVLNFALAHCPAERVLVLSSHTVLVATDGLRLPARFKISAALALVWIQVQRA